MRQYQKCTFNDKVDASLEFAVKDNLKTSSRRIGQNFVTDFPTAQTSLTVMTLRSDANRTQ